MITDTNIQSGTTSKFLTPEQAAELLQVSKRTMYEWLRSGEIPCEHIGERLIRIRESDILSPDVRVYYEQGCQLAQNPQTVDRAEAFFKKAIELNPHYGLAYFQCGLMLYWWGHNRRAIEYLEKAIELNPTFPAYMMLGKCYNLNTYQHHKAEEAIRKALELKPVDVAAPHLADAYHELGFAIIMDAISHKERMGEAAENFRKTLEIAKESGGKSHYRAAHFLGQILLFHAPDHAKALLLADEIEKEFPHESEHIRQMVEMYKPQAGKYAKPLKKLS